MPDTSNALVVHDDIFDLTRPDPEKAAAALAHVLATGDLANFSNEQRVAFYKAICLSFGLNMLARPFDWLTLDGRLILYPNKSCAEQLRRQHQISIKVKRFDVVGANGSDPMAVCTVEGRRPNGVTDESTKYVPLTGYNSRTQQRYRLSGKDLANAYAKCETSAKRRVTFSMVGLTTGDDDPSNARLAVVDGTGRIVEQPTDEDRALAADPRLAGVLGERTFESQSAATSFESAVSSAARPEELEPPARPYQRTTFRCDKTRWLKTWHMVVQDTFLVDDDARHDFVRWYTSSWPENRQTSSLSTYLDHATDRQAEALVNAARETLADRASFAPAERGDDDEDLPAALDRPLPNVAYDLAMWRMFYDTWALELERLDSAYTPHSAAVLAEMTEDELKREVLGIIGQVDSISIMLDQADEQEGPAF